MDEGLIEYHATNGTFRISHRGIKTVEDNIFDYSLTQPELKSEEYFNFSFKQIVNSLYEFNVLAENIFGVKIFKANSKHLSDLIQNCLNLNVNNRDENSFIQIILILSSLIDEIYFERIKKLIPVEDKSLRILEQLFSTKGIKIENEISNLISIRDLSNNYSPIHKIDFNGYAFFKPFSYSYNIKPNVTNFQLIIV